MSITIKNVYLDQPAAAGEDAFVTPDNTKRRIIKCTITNNDSSARTMAMHKKITSATAVADANKIMDAQPIGPSETYECPEIVGKVFPAGYALHLVPEVDNQLTTDIDVSDEV